MPDSQTFMLTSGPDTISGGGGDNTIIATDGTLSASDQIDGGSSGQNILSLQGTGTFDLTQPTTLTDIAVVDASETAGGSFQAVTMLSGLNVTVNVASVAGGQIYIYGANDADVFNLGGGSDTITLGSAAEIVNGGGGTAIVNVTAATAGAQIRCTSGTTSLAVSGGGSITPDSGDTGVYLITLANAATAYDLVTTSASDQEVVDNSTTDDVIQLNSATDTLFDRLANVTTQVTAANAGALIHGGTGADILEITTGGTVTLNPATAKVSILLNQATNLKLNNNVDNVHGSSGDDTIAITIANFRSRTVLNGGGGNNTLLINGSGRFRLQYLSAMTGFQNIDVYEGASQIVDSRIGLSADINVQAAAAGASDQAITLIGENDSVVFNLGAGTDTVTLGSQHETVNGGGGTALINAEASYASALINGGSGTTTLTIKGGGNVTLNALDSGISKVVLAITTLSRTFTANAEAGLNIDDLGFGGDTITLGGADQSITGGRPGQLTMVGANAGYDTFTDTAASINGDTIENFQQIGDQIDITNLVSTSLFGSFTENSAGTSASLSLGDGTHAFALTLTGLYAADGLPHAGIVVGSDGKGGTILEYAGTQSVTLDGSAGNRVMLANAAGDTLIGGAGDTLVGNSGADTFVFHAGFGRETVNNFDTTADVLQFDSGVFADWAHLLGATTQQGSDLLITLDANDVLTLKNVTLANFTSQDAKFV